MRHLLFVAAVCGLLFAPASYFGEVLEAATCVGATPCKACSNCKYCKHCAKDGGKCGVELGR